MNTEIQFSRRSTGLTGCSAGDAEQEGYVPGREARFTAAEAMLAGRGISVIPDFVANAGAAA